MNRRCDQCGKLWPPRSFNSPSTTCKHCEAILKGEFRPFKPKKQRKPPKQRRKTAGPRKTCLKYIKPRKDAFWDAHDSRCQVCGEPTPCCLVFHHIDPKLKFYNITNLWGCRDLNVLADELAKCVIICCNCHAKVHAKQIPSPQESPFNRRAFLDRLESLTSCQ